MLEHERVDWGDLDPGAGRAHVPEAGLEVLERRQDRALRARRLATQPLPESFHHLRGRADDQHCRQAAEVIGPGAELGEPAKACLGFWRTPALSAARPAGPLPCAMHHRRRDESHIEIRRRHHRNSRVRRRAFPSILERAGRIGPCGLDGEPSRRRWRRARHHGQRCRQSFADEDGWYDDRLIRTGIGFHVAIDVRPTTAPASLNTGPPDPPKGSRRSVSTRRG